MLSYIQKAFQKILVHIVIWKEVLQTQKDYKFVNINVTTKKGETNLCIQLPSTMLETVNLGCQHHDI